MKRRNKGKPHIVVSGYYGYGSIGDEAVLLSILEGIAEKMPGCTVSVLTADKSALPHIPGITLRAAFRLDPLSVIKALFTADIFISGGGSLMQDCTSSRSLTYYTTLIRLAKKLGATVYIYANGIGPLTNSRKASLALSCAERISVRDPESLNLARKLTEEKAEVVLSADPIFSYRFSNNRNRFLACFPCLFQKPFFAVSLRLCEKTGEIDRDTLRFAILQLKKQGLTPVFVSMQDSFDLEISKDMARLTGGIVADVRDADDLYCLLEKATFAIGMRLHFLLTALLAGKPIVALSYDCKVESCVRYMGINSVLSAFSFTSDELLSLVKSTRASFDKGAIMEKCLEMGALTDADRKALLSLLPAKEEDNCDDSSESMEKFFADT